MGHLGVDSVLYMWGRGFQVMQCGEGSVLYVCEQCYGLAVPCPSVMLQKGALGSYGCSSV